MKVEAKARIGVRGEITCRVIKGNGLIEEYPLETNTHTYTWFQELVGTGTNLQYAGVYTNAHKMYVSSAANVITKETTGISFTVANANGALIALTRETLLGVVYTCVEFEYAFALGAINTIIKSVGVYSANGGYTMPSSGMLCGKSLETPVVVTNEDQLIVKYKRFYSGPTAWSSNAANWDAELPVLATGTVISSAGDHSYNIKMGLFSMGYDNYPSLSGNVFGQLGPYLSGAHPYRSTLGGSQSYTAVTVTWIKTAGTLYNSDSAQYSYKITVSPSAGNFTIAELGIMMMTNPQGTPSTYGRIQFDPPINKPNTHKLAITVLYTVSWDNV